MRITIDRAGQGYNIKIEHGETVTSEEYYNCFSIPKDDTLICGLNKTIHIGPHVELYMFGKKVGKNHARLKKQREKYARDRKERSIRMAESKRELEVYYKN